MRVESMETGLVVLISHYHAVVFGSEFTHKGNWWIHHYESGQPVWTSDELIDLWPFGLPTVDIVTEGRCGYVAGYVQKKLYYDPKDYWDRYGCCVYPFQRSSQGIGLDYYVRHKHELWLNPNLRPRLQGVSYSMPRYFLKKDVELKDEFDDMKEKKALEYASARVDHVDKAYSGFLDQKESELKFRSRLTR